MKYKDLTGTGVIDGENVAANGIYVGQQIGKPMQDAKNTGANEDPYIVEHSTVHVGGITPDAQDSAFPDVIFEVFYDLNGAVGTLPASQVQESKGASITLSGAPSVTTYPAGTSSFKEWNTSPAGDGETQTASASFTPTQDTKFYAIYQA